MKTISKAIAIASLATVATAANAEVSVTGGIMSDYVFRGVQSSTGSGYAAVDYEQSGFTAGVWAADLDDAGLEVDIYLGYGIELENGLALSAGYTQYEYTDNGDNVQGDFEGGASQSEFNIAFGFAGFGLNYVLGTNNDIGLNNVLEKDQDYDVITLTYDAETWGVLVGMVNKDDIDTLTVGEEEYNWAEIYTSADVAGLTVTATVGVQFGAEIDHADGAALNNGQLVDTSSNDGYITFDISKSFDL